MKADYDDFEELQQKDIKKNSLIILEALDLNEVKPWLALASVLAVMKIIAKEMELPFEIFDKILKLMIKDYKDKTK